jgi:hypothetical protein
LKASLAEWSIIIQFYSAIGLDPDAVRIFVTEKEIGILNYFPVKQGFRLFKKASKPSLPSGEAAIAAI